MTEQHLLQIEKLQLAYEASFDFTIFHSRREQEEHERILMQGRKELESLWQTLYLQKEKLINKNVLDRSLTTDEVMDILIVGFNDVNLQESTMDFLLEALNEEEIYFGDEFMEVCEFAGIAINDYVKTTLDVLLHIKYGPIVEEKIIYINGFKENRALSYLERPTYNEYSEQDFCLFETQITNFY